MTRVMMDEQRSLGGRRRVQVSAGASTGQAGPADSSGRWKTLLPEAGTCEGNTESSERSPGSSSPRMVGLLDSREQQDDRAFSVRKPGSPFPRAWRPLIPNPTTPWLVSPRLQPRNLLRARLREAARDHHPPSPVPESCSRVFAAAAPGAELSPRLSRGAFPAAAPPTPGPHWPGRHRRSPARPAPSYLAGPPAAAERAPSPRGRGARARPQRVGPAGRGGPGGAREPEPEQGARSGRPPRARPSCPLRRPRAVTLAVGSPRPASVSPLRETIIVMHPYEGSLCGHHKERGFRTDEALSLRCSVTPGKGPLRLGRRSSCEARTDDTALGTTWG
nr:transcription initiation factor TFIID subunit 4-like [Equus asinus]